MKTILNKKQAKEEGFTLIELLIVIGTIGILAAVALPIFLNQQNDSIRTSIKSDVRNTITNVSTWIATNANSQVPSLDSPTVVGDAYQIISSNENIITVRGTDNVGEFVVEGSSPSLPNYFYKFDSRTGLYSTTTTASNN